MENLLSKVSIRVNSKVFLKDPESSELGRKIIVGSIDMIDELGFESFTFRKLGLQIKSPEASVYRYFESKHKLLLYLTSWYWGWMEYRLVFSLANIHSPEDRLTRAINLMTEEVKQDSSFAHINEVKLHRIVISESSKVYLTKEVDQENKEGAFTTIKQLVERISDIVLEINPNYKYPHMLVSTMIEGAHYQRFFSQHLPRLTDVVKGEDSVTEFYKDMILKAIKC
ncbi:TetR/AcrR family transcriptional regulator [Xanthovirga aplysinae]|uniref:TetR/AcrR family transcriptional regulator n=1 Tax=Xanthovirga aplysinae TaxID=2529853 RepID=UPI0012BB6C77|nr:TetR/AcrR family transcriptional regulator [Xanthovirga aplysinae]MTI32160.1 TetR/AcrR family transcriptional regulator [Xanthovirga aplysinae]